MNGQQTLLLAVQNPGLAHAVRQLRPDLAAVPLESGIPQEHPGGRLWCFVDWLLPDISGLEMCRRLREAPATRDGHITMVLEEPDTESRRRALRAGADDYVVGPLDPDTLLGRLSLYEQNGQAASNGMRISHGDLVVDSAAFQARYQGRLVVLRPNEFRLLAHFVGNPDKVFSRASLIGMIGKDSEQIDERTVDVWVGRLRRALKAHGVPDPLRTVRSMGYVLDGVEPRG